MAKKDVFEYWKNQLLWYGNGRPYFGDGEHEPPDGPYVFCMNVSEKDGDVIADVEGRLEELVMFINGEIDFYQFIPTPPLSDVDKKFYDKYINSYLDSRTLERKESIYYNKNIYKKEKFFANFYGKDIIIKSLWVHEEGEIIGEPDFVAQIKIKRNGFISKKAKELDPKKYDF